MRHQHKRTAETLIERPRDTVTKRLCLKKSSKQRRAIASITINSTEYYLHSTKGYRAMRA